MWRAWCIQDPQILFVGPVILRNARLGYGNLGRLFGLSCAYTVRTAKTYLQQSQPNYSDNTVLWSLKWVTEHNRSHLGMIMSRGLLQSNLGSQTKSNKLNCNIKKNPCTSNHMHPINSNEEFTDTDIIHLFLVIHKPQYELSVWALNLYKSTWLTYFNPYRMLNSAV